MRPAQRRAEVHADTDMRPGPYRPTSYRSWLKICNKAERIRVLTLLRLWRKRQQCREDYGADSPPSTARAPAMRRGLWCSLSPVLRRERQQGREALQSWPQPPAAARPPARQTGSWAGVSARILSGLRALSVQDRPQSALEPCLD